MYPAANSKYRTNIENGQDEELDQTQSDILNGFPSMKMTLLQGGCGFYEIPIKSGKVNVMIQPAKKKGEIYWVYKNFSFHIVSFIFCQLPAIFLRYHWLSGTQKKVYDYRVRHMFWGAH